VAPAHTSNGSNNVVPCSEVLLGVRMMDDAIWGNFKPKRQNLNIAIPQSKVQLKPIMTQICAHTEG